MAKTSTTTILLIAGVGIGGFWLYRSGKLKSFASFGKPPIAAIDPPKNKSTSEKVRGYVDTASDWLSSIGKLLNAGDELRNHSNWQQGGDYGGADFGSAPYDSSALDRLEESFELA